MSEGLTHLSLQHIELLDFKNFHEQSLDFCEGINCFLGKNGQGKTNLLDAIYYLSFTKSFSNPVDSQNIRDGQDFFLLEGQYAKGEDTPNVQVAVKKGKKKQVRYQKNAYKKNAEHIGRFPLVMICPEDAELILGGSEGRRKFMDGVISQFDNSYLNTLLEYNKVLAQRNAYLKKCAEMRYMDPDAMAVYDEMLAEHGHIIYEKRRSFIEGFIPLFDEIHQEITPGTEKVSLSYSSHLEDGDLVKLLEESVAKDRVVRHTSKGIHKDDLEFLLGEKSLKKFGSQGQQKSYLLAMKLAQYLYIEAKTSCVPILLLDDVFDKLDSARLSALLKLVGGPRFGQIFLTDTDAERIGSATAEIGKEKRIFEVHEGKVSTS